MLEYREYGDKGREVVLIHGGPGAPGTMGQVGREIADLFRVLEPFQRRSGEETLTVARHVEDLREFIAAKCGGGRPALVGHSWGAMLALAYGAAYPGEAGSIALVGCGTFDSEARARFRALIDERLDEKMKRRMAEIERECADSAERMRMSYKIIGKTYDYDAEEAEEGSPPCDVKGNEETWGDMLRLQEEGLYPGAFAAIRVPVVMIHGNYDPHPGRMIYEGLKKVMPQLQYAGLEKCGHEPWRERFARREFFRELRRLLVDRSMGNGQLSMGNEQ